MSDDLLDRDQLHDAFKSLGVENVNDEVCYTMCHICKLKYNNFQLIDKIFSKLDVSGTGYVTNEQLLSVINSLQECSSTSEEMYPVTSPASFTDFQTSSPSHGSYAAEVGPSSIHNSHTSLHLIPDLQFFSLINVGSGLGVTFLLQ